MSEVGSDPVPDLKAILAAIDRDLAESGKLRAETEKFVAEHRKLIAEQVKFDAEAQETQPGSVAGAVARDRWSYRRPAHDRRISRCSSCGGIKAFSV